MKLIRRLLIALALFTTGSFALAAPGPGPDDHGRHGHDRGYDRHHDGRRWHDDASDYEHDHEKWSVPARHGYRIVFATWDKVTRRPDELLGELTAAMRPAVA